eukprot:s1179_g10.t1
MEGALCLFTKASFPRQIPVNFITKAYHSVIRKHLVTAWSQVLTHLQLGGRKGLGCDTAHHLVHAHVAHGVVSKQPSGVVFVDFKAAFYSVLRQCLFAHPVNDDGFLVAMHCLGVHPDDVNRLLHNAQSDAAICNISPHALAVLQDVLRSTYFEIDGIPEVATTNRGTRPGDPIGDISFNLLMAVLLQDITHNIRAAGRIWEGAPVGIDDFSRCQSPATPVLRSHTNDQSRALRDQIRANQSCFEVPVDFGDGSCQVPVVLSYKHLATWIHNDAKPLHAVRDRIASARKAWGPLVRPFFSKSVIGFETKVRVFESLVMSRLLFNVHVWCSVSDAALEWEAGIRPMLYALVRPKLRGQPPFRFSADTLCGLCQILPPRDALHVARLRYLKRLVSYCPAVLWNLLRATEGSPGAWLSLLHDSLTWLVTFSSSKFGLDAQSDLQDWLMFAAVDDRWKGRLKRAVAPCKAYRYTHASTTEIWHAWLNTSFAQNGVEFVLPNSPQVALPWTCDLCDRDFHNKVALSMHAVKVHGYQTAVRHYAVDGQCPNCARDFHHRARLCAHLRTATECIDRIRASFPPLTSQVMDALNEADRCRAGQLKQQGWLQTKAELPVIRAFGSCQFDGSCSHAWPLDCSQWD